MLGPRGLLGDGGALLVVNRNVDLNPAGEVMAFNAATGVFSGAVVAATDKDAPFAPRGTAVGDENDLFVANLTVAKALRLAGSTGWPRHPMYTSLLELFFSSK